MNTSFYQIHRNNLHRFIELLKTNYSCMNYITCTILFIGFCLPSPNSKAQNIDSLFLKHADKGGKVNVDSVLLISKQYLYSRPAKAFEITERAVAIAEKQKDPIQLANSYRSKGAIFTLVNTDFDSSFHYLEKAEKLYRSLRTQEARLGLGGVYHNYGTVRQIQGDYVKAIEFYIQASKIFDEADDSKSLPYTLNNLATLYGLVGDAQKSEKYARECIALAQKNGDEFMTATGSTNLADALMNQGKYEEAIIPLNRILEYGEKFDDRYKTFLYHLNYGTYLMEYKKDFPSAIKEYEKARELAKEVDDEWEVMRKNVALSEAYLENHQFAEAKETAGLALKTAQKLQAKDKQRESLWVLAQSNAYFSDFETAFKQLKSAYLLKDTVFNENKQRHLALLETEYQTEKRETRISTLEKERVLYGIIFGVSFLGVIILLGALYLRQRAKKQLVQQQVIQLEKEKQLIATQATLEGETTERTRLARDLHDGLGSMLSVVKFNLPQMKSGVTIEQEDVSRFQKALGMLDQSIQELRRVAHHMMPETLVRFGLKTALTDFAEAIPNVDFHYFGNEERIAQKLEIMIYRSIHELVNNAMKHAEASQINVQLVQETSRISFTVQDNGKGFDPENIKDGMGLRNIRQRVETFSGKMNIYSTQKGTEINIELELKA